MAEELKGISSYKTFLMHRPKGKESWEKLIDIKETPDLGSAPATIDITTLSDKQKTYIAGLFDPGNLEFTANYTPDNYAACKAIEGEAMHDFAIWFGGTETANVLTPTGEWGKFEFQGELSCWVKGASVEAAVDLGISIAPSTEIKMPA